VGGRDVDSGAEQSLVLGLRAIAQVLPLRRGRGGRPVTRTVQIGDTIEVADDDYCFGTGTLFMKVLQVGPFEVRKNERWVSLTGTVLRSDGLALEPRPKHALVRLNGVRKRPR
jgi:hypothetical protein